MREGVLQNPNYAAWRDEITNDYDGVHRLATGDRMSTKGRKPENLQVGRLEIAKEKELRERARKKEEKKSELGCKNAGPRVKC
jgi:hypothetical protein